MRSVESFNLRDVGHVYVRKEAVLRRNIGQSVAFIDRNTANIFTYSFKLLHVASGARSHVRAR